MTWRRRILYGVGILLGILGICVLARPVRTALFPWTVNRVLETSLLTYPPWGFSLTEVEPGEQVEVAADLGRRLPADFFRASDSVRGRILFVHGSIPKGRRFSPYRFLAARIAEAGYHVLLPDIGGFGESLIAAEALPTFGADVAAAARALDDLVKEDDTRGPIVIAHSLGASMALAAVVRHGLKPWKMVIWDPPISGEIFTAIEGASSALDRFRSEIQVVGGGILSVDDDNLMKYFRSLEPLELLRSMKDPRPATLAAIGSLIEDHRPLLEATGIHVDWLTVLDLSGIDHFLDMVSLGGSDRTLLYRPGTPRLFVDSVVEWLEMHE